MQHLQLYWYYITPRVGQFSNWLYDKNYKWLHIQLINEYLLISIHGDFTKDWTSIHTTYQNGIKDSVQEYQQDQTQTQYEQRGIRDLQIKNGDLWVGLPRGHPENSGQLLQGGSQSRNIISNWKYWLPKDLSKRRGTTIIQVYHKNLWS